MNMYNYGRRLAGAACGALACYAGLVSPASAQDAGAAAPVGMVDDPCPPARPLPGLTADGQPPQFSEADLQAIQEDVARRLQSDWGWLCRFRDDNDGLTEPPRVVFMGDSITQNWSGMDPDFFAAGIVNRGISGQTSPQMLVRFYQDVIALRPDAVHIMAGTNDLAGNTGPNRPEDFKNSIRAMSELAEANGIAVILASIPPADAFPWRPEVSPAPRIAELNAWLEQYAAENGFVYVDYHSAMAGPSGELKPELTFDGVHPDAEGYAVMRPLAMGAMAASRIETAN